MQYRPQNFVALLWTHPLEPQRRDCHLLFAANGHLTTATGQPTARQIAHTHSGILRRHPSRVCWHTINSQQGEDP